MRFSLTVCDQCWGYQEEDAEMLNKDAEIPLLDCWLLLVLHVIKTTATWMAISQQGHCIPGEIVHQRQLKFIRFFPACSRIVHSDDIRKANNAEMITLTRDDAVPHLFVSLLQQLGE